MILATLSTDSVCKRCFMQKKDARVPGKLRQQVMMIIIFAIITFICFYLYTDIRIHVTYVCVCIYIYAHIHVHSVCVCVCVHIDCSRQRDKGDGTGDEVDDETVT